MSFEKRSAILMETARALSKGDASVLGQVMLRDFYNYSPKSSEETQAEVFSTLAGDILAALPGLAVSVDNLREEGEDIFFDLTLAGKHINELWGAPGTGAEIAWTSEAAVRFDGDKFAFHWPNLTLPQVIGTARQVGLVPPPEDMDKPPEHPVSMPEIMMRTLFTGQVAEKACSHMEDIKVTDTDVDVCQQCVDSGDGWPALRMCLICGFVGCCDTSKNKHMKAHYEETGHAIMRSIRLDEAWIWCYADNAMLSSRHLDRFRS